MEYSFYFYFIFFYLRHFWTVIQHKLWPHAASLCPPFLPLPPSHLDNVQQEGDFWWRFLLSGYQVTLFEFLTPGTERQENLLPCTWDILQVLPWRWWSQCSVPEGRKGTSHPRNSCWSLCLCILSWPSCKSHNIQFNRTEQKIATALLHELTWYNARKLWQIFVPKYLKNTLKNNLSLKCIKHLNIKFAARKLRFSQNFPFCL